MLSVLNRKLLRDTFASLGTLASILLIIGIGIGAFVGLGTAQRNLVESQASYYRAYHFADVWVDLKKAPLSVTERIRSWPEIARLDARVVFDVILDVPDETRPLSARLISTPSVGYDRTLNGIHLVRGSGFSQRRDSEAIISEDFAKARGLDPGDRLHVILNRKRESFVIVGTAISPEYAYMVRGPGDIIPDPEHFGVLYVKERFARDVLGFKDACNQVVCQLTPSAAARPEDLLARLERVLEPFGVLEVVPRKRQASHRFLSDEIDGLGKTATVMPAVFLSVAALALNILMLRLAQRQRAVIGTLKAIGYSDRQVMWHYLSFGVVVGIAGALGGAALGLGMAYAMIETYKSFFSFPGFAFHVYPDLLIWGLVISVGFSILGTFRGVLAVLRLQPAAAMRQNPPERGGAILLERCRWFWRLFGFRTHMAFRSVFRNHFRTATSIFATAVSISIILMALVLFDSFISMIDYQFDAVAHSDLDVGMRDEESLAALFEAQALPGVELAEPLFGLRCDLAHGAASRRMAISGLVEGHRLTTPRRADGAVVDIPPHGLVFSRKLADLLGVDVGDAVRVTPVRGRRQMRRAPIVAITDTFIGLDCYADLRYLSTLVGESLVLNSVQLLVDEPQRAALYRRIKTLPNAQGLSVRAETKRNLERTLVETGRFSIGLMVLFAGAISFGSALNNALIEIGDRLREISTLRVLGYSPAEVAGILIRQNMIIFVLGVLLAGPMGYGLIQLVSQAYDTELFRMPIRIKPEVAGLTALLALLFVLSAQVLVYWQVRKLNWLEGVKVKE